MSNMMQRNPLKPVTMAMNTRLEGIFLGFQPAKYGHVLGMITEHGDLVRVYTTLTIDASLFPSDVGRKICLFCNEMEQGRNGNQYPKVKVYVEVADGIGQDQTKKEVQQDPY